jgi:hypothetical protein
MLRSVVVFARPMPRGVLKQNLPSKLCTVCQRPFTWRKKWERCWEEVKFCSKRCRGEKKDASKKDGAGEESGDD